MVELMSHWSISSQVLVDEAESMGYEVQVLNRKKNFFLVSSPEKSILFKSVDCGLNSALALKVANDKQLTELFLKRNGVSTPRSMYIFQEELEEFDRVFVSPQFPLVVKPVDGAHGDGITTGVSTLPELKKSLEYAFEFSDRAVVQNQIVGEEIRVLVLGDEVVYCKKRVPAFVTGDGKSTISQLIEKENKNPLRGSESYIQPLSKIIINDRLMDHLEEKNKHLDSVPEKGEHVQVMGVSNIAAGGVPINVTDEVCQSLKDECVKAAKVLGLGIAGIDVMTSDPCKPLAEVGGAILEVGATPGIGSDRDVMGVNTASHVLRYAFKHLPGVQ